MEKLSLSLDKELDVMCKFSLNAEEWMFTKLLFIALDGQPGYLMRYANECAKIGLPRETLASLRKKGILDKSYKVPNEGEQFVLSTIKFSVPFTKKYFRTSFEAGQELFDAYPDYMYTSDGRMLPLRNITKAGFECLDDFFFAYCKAIKYDPSTHELVLKSLEFAKENSLVNYGITEYLASRKWSSHLKMMEEDEIGKFTVKFDTIETL